MRRRHLGCGGGGFIAVALIAIPFRMIFKVLFWRQSLAKGVRPTENFVMASPVDRLRLEMPVFAHDRGKNRVSSHAISEVLTICKRRDINYILWLNFQSTFTWNTVFRRCPPAATNLIFQKLKNGVQSSTRAT